MPIEEITLSVPDGSMESQRGGSGHVPNSKGERAEAAGTDKLVAAYLKSARARDRFAFTDKGHMRNRERFAQSLKAIVKKIAADASNPLEDRSARMQVRTRIYGDVMKLANAMSKDQLAMIRWNRIRWRWSLALATVGLLGIAHTLVMNDIVKWPLGAQ